MSEEEMLADVCLQLSEILASDDGPRIQITFAREKLELIVKELQNKCSTRLLSLRETQSPQT